MLLFSCITVLFISILLRGDVRMKDYSLYENVHMPYVHFPIWVSICNKKNKGNGVLFESHWHEQMEFLYFVKGKATIKCNFNSIDVKPKDLIVVNSNELHSGEMITDEIIYYVIIIDNSLLHSSSIDTCETKYITPITQNYILFKNKICEDENILGTIIDIILELEKKDLCYELAVKSSIYRLLTLMIRNHLQRMMTENEYALRTKKIEKLNELIKYIEENYSDKTSIESLSRIANMSKFHFCRVFKEITGKTVGQYINGVRINKAEYMLTNSDMNVSEIALSAGFEDINYFSRVFRKYKNMSPTSFRQSLITKL